MKPSEEESRILREIYLEAAEKQLEANEPIETRQTYDRLRKLGIAENEAKMLIASVIAVESYAVMKHQAPYDQARFVRNLNRLPDQSSFEE